MNLAKVYIDKALPGWGKRALTEAAEKGEGGWRWHSFRGQCALMELNLKEAQTELESALNAGPDKPSCYVQLARTLLMGGQVSEAVELLGRGLQHLGQDPALAHLYTQALDLKGESDAALAYLDKMDVRSDSLDNQRITLLLKQGDFQASGDYNQWALRQSLKPGTWESCLRYLSSIDAFEHSNDLAHRIAREWRRFEKSLGY